MTTFYETQLYVEPTHCGNCDEKFSISSESDAAIQFCPFCGDDIALLSEDDDVLDLFGDVDDESPLN